MKGYLVYKINRTNDGLIFEVLSSLKTDKNRGRKSYRRPCIDHGLIINYGVFPEGTEEVDLN